MLNCLNLVGRLTKDPELKALGDNNVVAKFTIAVDRNYKDKDGNRPADFIPCEAFGKTAEFVSNYITKGRLVEVEGEMRVDQYQNEAGENRSFTKCHVNTLNALDSAKSADGAESKGQVEAPKAPKVADKPARKPSFNKPPKAVTAK